MYKDSFIRIQIDVIWFEHDSNMVGKNFDFCISSMPSNAHYIYP